MADAGPGLVTVFGGSGFVGSQAVRALAKRGWRVRVAVRSPNSAYELRPLGDPGQIQLVRCDVTNVSEVSAALKGADAAVNLVGILYETPRGTFERMHVDAARVIAEACVMQSVGRLVQVSAIGADVNSKGLYGWSKGQAEVVMREIKPDTVVLRPSIVFGAGDGFLNRFASMATMAPALPLVGGGGTKFQPVYVGDVAEAIARSVVTDSAAGRTYELGGPSVWSFRDILEYILRETGRARMLAPLPFPIARIVGSMAQLTAVVGIAPVLTKDQVTMLETDNVVSPGALTLHDLGIEATGLEAIAPSYLWRYRKGGQFAESPAAA